MLTATRLRHVVVTMGSRDGMRNGGAGRAGGGCEDLWISESVAFFGPTVSSQWGA